MATAYGAVKDSRAKTVSFKVDFQPTPLDTEVQSKSSSRLFPVGYVLLFLVAASAFAVINHNLKTEISNVNFLRFDEAEISSDPLEDTDSADDVSFTLYRHGYDSLPYFAQNRSSVLTYKILENYVAVVEPYQPMYLEVHGFETGGKYDYKFSMCGDRESDECKHGYLFHDGSMASVTMDCEPYSEYKISVSQYLRSEDDDGSELLVTTVKSALCLYVRREIRSLSSSDISDTMDAMFTMWEVSYDDGQSMYGEDYADAKTFVEAHEFNSAQQDADHMHEGIGFLPQHIKLSNLFENSLTSIDPSVSLPYWDFTIDRSASTSIFDSEIFCEDIFGTLKKPNNSFWGWTYKHDKLEDAHIQDGRWKKIQVNNNDKFSDLKNSFGTVRGMWTVNPSKYVSRFTTTSPVLPGCSSHYDLLSMTDLGAFFYSAGNSPHASTHGAVAATFGCDVMDQMLDHGYLSDESSQLAICTQWGFILKDLFRANYISARENCSATSYERDDIDCGFTCNEDLYDDMPAFLQSSFKSDWTNAIMTETGWEAWRTFICEGEGFKVFFGDHLDPSVSPADPSFWVIHTTLERVLHAKYMSGGFDDDIWPSDPINDYVCTLAECYSSETGTTDYHKDCCYGHYEYDQLMDYMTGNRSNGIGMTTHDLLLALRPDSEDYSMPYIYDSFTWDHCGEDFSGLIDELAVRDEIRVEDKDEDKDGDEDKDEDGDKDVDEEKDADVDATVKEELSKDEDTSSDKDASSEKDTTDTTFDKTDTSDKDTVSEKEEGLDETENSDTKSSSESTDTILGKDQDNSGKDTSDVDEGEDSSENDNSTKDKDAADEEDEDASEKDHAAKDKDTSEEEEEGEDSADKDHSKVSNTEDADATDSEPDEDSSSKPTKVSSSDADTDSTVDEEEDSESVVVKPVKDASSDSSDEDSSEADSTSESTTTSSSKVTKSNQSGASRPSDGTASSSSSNSAVDSTGADQTGSATGQTINKSKATATKTEATTQNARSRR